MAGVSTKTNSEPGFIRKEVLSIMVTIDSTAVDASNTGMTHILQPGLALGQLTGANFTQYVVGAADGTETCTGILVDPVDLKDGDPAATSVDHAGKMLVLGYVKEAETILIDAAAIVDLAGKIWFY